MALSHPLQDDFSEYIELKDILVDAKRNIKKLEEKIAQWIEKNDGAPIKFGGYIYEYKPVNRVVRPTLSAVKKQLEEDKTKSYYDKRELNTILNNDKIIPKHKFTAKLDDSVWMS